MANNTHLTSQYNNSFRTLEQIHQGIEDYFECRLSDQQEQQLRHALVSMEHLTPQMQECIAVMGFKPAVKKSYDRKTSLPHKSSLTHKTPLSSQRTWIAVASSIIVAVLISVPLLVSNGDNSLLGKSDCYAYVGGEMITDEDVIISMLMEDFEEFDQSINQINDDFDTTMEYLSQIIEENENPL